MTAAPRPGPRSGERASSDATDTVLTDTVLTHTVLTELADALARPTSEIARVIVAVAEAFARHSAVDDALTALCRVAQRGWSGRGAGPGPAGSGPAESVDGRGVSA